MSCANLDHKDPLHGAITEIISGQSSLHMEPQPIEPEYPDDTFLTDTDHHVKHSLEHFKAAMQLIGRAGFEMRRMERWLGVLVAHAEGKDVFGPEALERVIADANKYLRRDW